MCTLADSIYHEGGGTLRPSDSTSAKLFALAENGSSVHLHDMARRACKTSMIALFPMSAAVMGTLSSG